MNRDIAASVHQRLLDKARAESRPFNELLQRYVNERFLGKDELGGRTTASGL